MRDERGITLFITLVFWTILFMVLVALVSWFISMMQTTTHSANRTQALHIAEAGIEYYRWRLAHDPDDFTDGTGLPGPYIHDFHNASGTKIGEYAISVVPPSLGSSVVTIHSTGTLSQTGTRRAVRSQLSVPAISVFEILSDANLQFGTSSSINGRIHSNEGIRFDGLAQNIVSSSRETYDDPSHTGSDEWAVHTHATTVDPLPPTILPTRSDVFSAGRLIAQPAIDFTGMTVDYLDIFEKAHASGTYIGPSQGLGYRIELQTDDTYDLYEVNTTVIPHWSCDNTLNEDGWESWSIDTESLVGNFAFPENGLVYVDDHVWVEGSIDGAHITITAAHFPDFPGNRKNIIVNNNLTYTNNDGTDGIGLLAQNNINIGLESADDLEIDGVLFAQHGRVGRHYYRDSWSHSSGSVIGCSPYHARDSITLDGLIGSKQAHGFAFSDTTGYATRTFNYDSDLLTSPPPELPFIAEDYSIVDWRELRP